MMRHFNLHNKDSLVKMDHGKRVPRPASHLAAQNALNEQHQGGKFSKIARLKPKKVKQKEEVRLAGREEEIGTGGKLFIKAAKIAGSAIQKTGKFILSALIDAGETLVLLAKLIVHPRQIYENFNNIKVKLKSNMRGERAIFSSLVFSEVVGIAIGLAAALSVAATGSTMAAAGSVWIVGGYAAAVVGFQLAYLAQTWRAYRHRHKENFKSFLEAEKDMIKVHINCALASAGFYIASAAGLIGGTAATGSTVGTIIAATLASIPLSIAYLAAVSVFSMKLYPKVTGLLNDYEEFKKSKKNGLEENNERKP